MNSPSGPTGWRPREPEPGVAGDRGLPPRSGGVLRLPRRAARRPYGSTPRGGAASEASPPTTVPAAPTPPGSGCVAMAGHEIHIPVPAELPLEAASRPGPGRVELWRCIACGAMGMQDDCTGACADHAVELVRAADHDAAVARAAELERWAARLEAVVRAMGRRSCGRRDWERTWRGWQRAARAALAPPARPPLPRLERVYAWWCADLRARRGAGGVPRRLHAAPRAVAARARARGGRRARARRPAGARSGSAASSRCRHAWRRGAGPGRPRSRAVQARAQACLAALDAGGDA